MIGFRLLGVAGFELEWNGSILLVDPFLTRPPAYKLLFGRARPDGELLRQHLPRADHILVSHSHYDHLLDVPEIASYTGARVYGSLHTCCIVEACGLPADQIHQVRVGEKLHLGEFDVAVLHGEHVPLVFYGPGKLPAKLVYPLRLRDFVLDETFSFHIQAGETSLLAWHNHHPKPAPRADVLLLIPDIIPADLPELLAQVQPRLLIPLHWDNFFRPLEKPLHVSIRIPTWRRPLIERADPQKMKRWVEQVGMGVEVWVPGVLERINV